MDIPELVKSLDKAKQAVHWLVDKPDSLVDMHGLEYWAGEVIRLRKAIRELV